MRSTRYGGVFLAFFNYEQRIEVYNSFPLNDCPDDLGRAFDSQAIAKENGAALAVLNGPRYWLMDGSGKMVSVELRLRNLGGFDVRCGATLDFVGRKEKVFYAERHVNRGAIWYFDTGTRSAS